VTKGSKNAKAVYTYIVLQQQLKFHLTGQFNIPEAEFRKWSMTQSERWAKLSKSSCRWNRTGAFPCHHPLCPGCWYDHTSKVLLFASDIPLDKDTYIFSPPENNWADFDPAVAKQTWPRTRAFRLIGTALRCVPPNQVISASGNTPLSIGHLALVIRNKSADYVTEATQYAFLGLPAEVLPKWVSSQIHPSEIYDCSDAKYVIERIRSWMTTYRVLQSYRTTHHRSYE